MQGFSANDILQLQEIITEGDPIFAKQHINGEIGESVLNPGRIGGAKGKVLAKPHAKIVAKINNRNIGTGETKTDNKIWDNKEITDQPHEDKRENRPKPEYEVMFKQHVGTGDVYLGMGNLDPSSSKCQFIKIKIKLPNTQLPEIQCDITDKMVTVQTPRYYMRHYFNNEAKDKEAKAKWVTDVQELHLDIPLNRDTFFS